MYDIIYNIIDHVWDVENLSNDEQIAIYGICGTFLLILTVFILDKLFDFIISVAKGGK